MSNDLNKMVAAMYGIPVFQTEVHSGKVRMYAGGKVSRYLETLEHTGYIKPEDFTALRTLTGSSLAFVCGDPKIFCDKPNLCLNTDMCLLIKHAQPSGKFAHMPNFEFQELLMQESRRFLALIKRQTNNAYKYVKRNIAEGAVTNV